MRRPKARGNKATQLSQQVSYRWQFPERTLHVVDIENLAGAVAIPTLIQVNEVQDWYLTRLGIRSGRPGGAASSHLGFINAALGWPHARYKVRSGGMAPTLSCSTCSSTRMWRRASAMW